VRVVSTQSTGTATYGLTLLRSVAHPSQRRFLLLCRLCHPRPNPPPAITQQPQHGHSAWEAITRRTIQQAVRVVFTQENALGESFRKGECNFGVSFVLTSTSPVHVAPVVPAHGNSLGGVYSSSKQVPIVAGPLEKADAVKGVPTRTKVALTLTAPTHTRAGSSPTMRGSVPGESPLLRTLLSSLDSDYDIPG
jgi:hypothetical protein